LAGGDGVGRRDEGTSVVEAGAVTPSLRERATQLQAEFEALPLEADGTMRPMSRQSSRSRTEHDHDE
jgi:hypothetical protein